MFDFGIGVAIAVAQMECDTIERMRRELTPEQFRQWQAERTAERRHRELCRSIEKAGENARTRGLGVLW